MGTGNVLFTHETYHEATFEHWTNFLTAKYGNRNKKRTPSEMWLKAVSDASKVGEAVRKGEPYEALTYLVHTFGWVITACNKLTIWDEYNGGKPAILTYDGKRQSCLTDIVLGKYPAHCPYCRKRLCECALRRKDNEGEKKEDRKQGQRKFSFETYIELSKVSALPRTISGLSLMFDNVYGQAHYEISIEKITFHFLEEIGEVAQCITGLHDNSKNKDTVSFNIQLSEELADVVAWGFAVVEKLSALAKDSQKLAKVFFAEEQYTVFMSTFKPDHKLLSYWMWKTFTERQ